jgi:hypothetical protein
MSPVVVVDFAMASNGADSDTFELRGLVLRSERVTRDFSNIAASLNTAPLTLAALAKECQALTRLLNRVEEALQSPTEQSSSPLKEFGVSCDTRLRALESDLSFLETSAGRIRPASRDSGVIDVGETASSLIIIWNEESLKQATRRLKEHSRDFRFLLDCIQE